MSFQFPRNVPDFENPHRRNEDTRWSSSGRSRHTGSNGSTTFAFRGPTSELPMYKDKPYNYPTSQRRRSIRLWAVVGFGIVTVWFLLFSGWRNGGGARLIKAKSSLWNPLSSSLKGEAAWAARRQEVVKAMKLSWRGYEKYAWGYDEYHPNSKSGRQMVPPTGLGWIIVDALDTLMLMNLTTELQHARDWISTTLTYNLDHDVNTFETTIRMLGGFLAAHYIQTEFPNMCPVDLGRDGEDLYLEKATDLADRLLGAFDSPTGIPYASINLKTMKGILSHSDGGASSLSEATTVQLEMKYLAKLTGEKSYWDKAERVMKAIDEDRGLDGLKVIYVSPESGKFVTNNIRLGSRGDSYYEYLIKQYLQTSKQEPIYLDMWEESLAGVKKHLITYSSPSNFTVLAERPSGLNADLEPKMDHLVCFMPGTIALSATGGVSIAQAKQSGEWNEQKEENLELAKELMKTCWGMYKVTRTGLAPEIAYFHLPEHPHMMTDGVLKSPEVLDDDPDASWREDYIIKPLDGHNLLRPETVESLFYMWRITGDEMYRSWGWEMFQSFEEHTRAPDEAGYSSIRDVNEVPSSFRDNMESFWPAETLKYFYLLFGPTDLLPLDKIVFNTEAHPLPRFELGKNFYTGWSRKSHAEAKMAVQDSLPENDDPKWEVVDKNKDTVDPTPTVAVQQH